MKNMEDFKIEKYIDLLTDSFFQKYSDISKLFDADTPTKQVIDFYNGNRNNACIQIIHINEEISDSELDEFKHDYGEKYIRDKLIVFFDTILEKKDAKTVHSKILKAALIYIIKEYDEDSKYDISFSEDDLNNQNMIYDGNNYNDDIECWFRGQSNYSWHLQPSMYRNLNNVFPKQQDITFNQIADIYSKNGMVDKWSKITNRNQIDYKFISFMQHSISYSPFIDFTKDIVISLSFALGNKSALNDFYQNDAAIYKLKLNRKYLATSMEKVDDILVNEYYVDYLPKPYKIGSALKGMKVITFKDIISALTPKYLMIPVKTNDRMLYQNGVFVLFYDCALIQGNVFAWLNKDIKLNKLRIDKSDNPNIQGKRHFYDTIQRDYPHYSQSKLLNPYDYYND